MRAPIDADDAAETAGAPRRDAGDGILDDNRARRFHFEAPCRFQEGIGRRLAVEREPDDFRTVHARFKELRYIGGLEHRRAVDAGRHHRGLDLLRPQRAHERDRRFIGLDAVLLQLFHEIVVLEVAECVHGSRAGSVFDRAEWQCDSARLKERRHAVVARLAVDVAAIVGVDVKGDECFACGCSPLL